MCSMKLECKMEVGQSWKLGLAWPWQYTGGDMGLGGFFRGLKPRRRGDDPPLEDHPA
jgi:hypothetical protein